MNKDNFYKAKELKDAQYHLRLLNDMIGKRFFGLQITKRWFIEDDYFKINFYEFDDKTRIEFEKVISDFCDKRLAEIDAEFEEL